VLKSVTLRPNCSAGVMVLPRQRALLVISFKGWLPHIQMECQLINFVSGLLKRRPTTLWLLMVVQMVVIINWSLRPLSALPVTTMFANILVLRVVQKRL
jgi:hypothetical protein